MGFTETAQMFMWFCVYILVNNLKQSVFENANVETRTSDVSLCSLVTAQVMFQVFLCLFCQQGLKLWRHNRQDRGTASLSVNLVYLLNFFEYSFAQTYFFF